MLQYQDAAHGASNNRKTVSVCGLVTMKSISPQLHARR
jgi:hypothetical protein